MFNQRQYQSAMLIPPECACIASSSEALPSSSSKLDYGDSNRTRTASLPSIAMTQGHQLLLYPNDTKTDTRIEYVPGSEGEGGGGGGGGGGSACPSRYPDHIGGGGGGGGGGGIDDAGTNRIPVPDTLSPTTSHHSGRITSPDSMPTLPCPSPVLVRPGTINNIVSGGSNPELGHTGHDVNVSFPHHAHRANTSATHSSIPMENVARLQREYNSLLSVDALSKQPPASNEGGGSWSHLDAYSNRHHHLRKYNEEEFDSTISTEKPKLQILNKNSSPSDSNPNSNQNFGAADFENPFWPEQTFPGSSFDGGGCNSEADGGDLNPSEQSGSGDNIGGNSNPSDECNERASTASNWSNVELVPVVNPENPFPTSISSYSTGSHYDNIPGPCPGSGNTFLQPPIAHNDILHTESWPPPPPPPPPPQSTSSNPQTHPPFNDYGKSAKPSVVESNNGHYRNRKPSKHIDDKEFTIVDIDSENDDFAAENASLIPTSLECSNQPIQSPSNSLTTSSYNSGETQKLTKSNNFNKNAQLDSPRGSFNEKQKRNSRKFRRKNSSNLIISQTAHHRNEFGKAAKRLCLWKQKLAKSRQNPRQSSSSPTTNDSIPMHSIPPDSVTTSTHSSFTVNPQNPSSSTSSQSPYYYHHHHHHHHNNEIESQRSGDNNVGGAFKKSKNANAKQKSSKKNSSSAKTSASPPTIVLSAPSPEDLGGHYSHCSNADLSDNTSALDSDAIHSSDYDTMERGFPSSSPTSTIPRNTYLLTRQDLNAKRSGPQSSSSAAARPFRLRRSSRRLACNGHKAEFTVVPVKNETNLREQERSKRGDDSSLRVPVSGFEIDGEPTDTLTQNSITSLLSAKFRDVAKRWKQYGVESPRFRKRIHSKWESMNYDTIDSKLSRELEHDTSKRKLALQWLLQWFIYFLIGVGTAFLAAGVQISVEIIAHEKFDLIRGYLDKCSKESCSLVIPVMIWVGMNAGITLLGAALVTFVQPMAAGSGIPLIKSYLNGVRIPGLLSLRAFIAKCVGVILSILGGLACGKEGPMAHSGGIMGAGFGKGRIPWFGKDISLYGMFRNDHNIRDLVAAGAASGVSAAFGAPVGGTLFSIEEAASFWNTELVWRVFFSAMIACFSTNFLLSAFEGHPTQLSNPGLVRFNTFPNLTFDLIEIPVFILLAVIGGLTGSLFVVMNYKLTVFRQKYLHRRKWIKVVEAALVAVTSAIVAFILMYTVNDCTEATPRSHHAILTKMGCEGKAHNSMSTLFLTTPEGCLKSLLHDPLETYSVLSLVLFIVIFFLLGVWTYGLSVSSGVFIPSLAIGAAWGRLIGMGVVELFPDQAKDVGKYALIGAASQLGGILRTTISLTVIIVECTGDITFGLCIMISLMISKWVGDFFTTGLYDMNVEVSGIPLLSWEPPPLCDHVKVSDFMSQPVMSMLQVEKVSHVLDCLKGENFHGFPIIEQDPAYDLMYKGKLKGLILRSQLLVLLRNKAFCPEGDKPRKIVDLSDFDNPYPVSQRLSIEDIEVTDEEKDHVMDLGPYMSQTPYVISPNFSMPRTFRLFRGLGLRHLIIINDEFEPVGMVTRKDLAKYRAGIKKGMLHMEQLTVENR